MAVERTLSIIKPDAVAKNVIGQILGRFEKAGLRIVAARMKETLVQARLGLDDGRVVNVAPEFADCSRLAVETKRIVNDIRAAGAVVEDVFFRLPAAAYAGDRRMFAFMHDGWHDAGNFDMYIPSTAVASGMPAAIASRSRST